VEKLVNYPYPLPEFIAYLEQMHTQPSEDPEHYARLADILQTCFSVVEEANARWRVGTFAREDTFFNSEILLGSVLGQLIPAILKGMIGGWFELLCYIDDPENYPWYDPAEEYPSDLFPKKNERNGVESDQTVEVAL
jgi:hypothetical protein